ncbi:MAG: hypothetical protein JRI49_03030 [Deltaproteobacteria bacterium]|nr:hypothetical protein [Deltaproteobacteria bacterium]
MKEKKERYVAVCPKCGSDDVKMETNPAYATSGLNMQFKQCMNCGHHGQFFPEVPKSKVTKNPKKPSEVKDRRLVQTSYGKANWAYVKYIGLPITLIFLTILGIMFFSGNFDPSRNSIGFPSIGSPEDWSLDSSGNFDITLKNRLETSIDISNVEITLDSVSDSFKPIPSITLESGDSYRLSSQETGLNLGSQSGTYSVFLSITYNKSGILPYTETGRLSGTVS